jgi:hypothetical protein
MVYLGIPKMSEKTIVEGIAGVVRTYELMDRVRTRQDLVIRDDQFDYETLLDAARYAGRRRFPLSLLDTGRFDPTRLEALAEAGSRILTSDEARPRADEWEVLARACREGGTHLAAFWNGPLPSPDPAEGLSLQALTDLLGQGLDLHVTDRAHARDPEILAGLAAAAKKGRGYFVVYHSGPLVPELSGPAGRRAWIHFSDHDAAEKEWAERAAAIARAASAAGSRAVVHVERGLDLETFAALWDAGAALVVQTPPSDDRSLLRPLEEKARRRKVPVRAFYLSTAFLP